MSHTHTAPNSSPAKARIALVDDNPQVARDLQRILAPAPDLEWLQHYSDGDLALSHMQATPDDRPELLLMDLDLGRGRGGVECIGLFRKALPEIKVVAYTVFEDVDHIFAAIQNGAAGYLLKDTSPELLLAELRVMYLGGAPMTPGVAARIIQHSATNAPATPARPASGAARTMRKLLRRPDANQAPASADPGAAVGTSAAQSAESAGSRAPAPQGPHDSAQTSDQIPEALSARETEILNCVSVGMSYPRIAESLGISVHTVRRHIENIYRKLNVHSRLDAVLQGRRMGIVDDS